MSVPEREIAGCRQAHLALLQTLAGLTDDVVLRPSRLPDWTVGHVLTHIARNADSVVRRLAGAGRGEVVDQYVGGPEGRRAEIEQGAARPAAELVADVATSAEAVERACREVPPDAWERPTRSVSGQVTPAWAVVRSRWREVEVHHVDLGLGYEPQRWPPELVDEWLVDQLPQLATRGHPAELLAWLLGRGPAPTLTPWG